MSKITKTHKPKLLARKSSITGRSIRSNDSSSGGKIRSKHTRQIIRHHHTLIKNRAVFEQQLRNTKDALAISQLRLQIDDITKQLNDNGGLEKYQRASIAGQDPSRGGDSSKMLVEWLKELGTSSKQLSLLEVGCLYSKNACTLSGLFEHIERIDLNSQEKNAIKQQDFMERPLPSSDSERFNVISLSLVVNYVATSQGRGDMLKRTVEFLKEQPLSSYLPALFLVLPEPCVNNARYFTKDRLTEIMQSLGYKLVRTKVTSRMIYWLWTYEHGTGTDTKFAKVLLNSGKTRNNFTITL